MHIIALYIYVLGCLSQVLETKETGGRLSKAEFDACVKKCGDQFEECTKNLRQFWKYFSKNKLIIMQRMSRCCLDGERNNQAPPTMSFATCVRDNCRAGMWG
ncbi:hypothetical protein CRM22_000162 [Opisthorchis felineus]|uniref:Uncharacterized protein n=1 Tax=Opisthorchis felineus TaxID=147828 RepID=A0A4V3SFQ2_OPIFE|nr:hypothetical protein CRM22_003794 [Opisthorchis felineus]TGZ75835.1 hypothetical protein CRM22_000162 [Opisthorchis felineus]